MSEIYLSAVLHGQPILVRDICEKDIQAIVRYWHGNAEEYWRSIGVDVKKIVSEEITAETFRRSIPGNRGPLDRITLVAQAEDRVIGYTNVNLESPTRGYGHVHVIAPSMRSKGVAAFLFFDIVKVFFEHYGLETLLFQTSISNRRVNAMLKKRGLFPVRDIEVIKPDGMALPGMFHVYELNREVINRLSPKWDGADGHER